MVHSKVSSLLWLAVPLLVMDAAALPPALLMAGNQGAGEIEAEDSTEPCRVDQTVEGPEIVSTDKGAVRGSRSGSTYAFKGIPYAAPPVGDLRWRPPRRPKYWKGVRPATEFGNQCPQQSAITGQSQSWFGNEDCLYLNVWTPADRKRGELMPVLFFIHGGGNTRGASNFLTFGAGIYDGQRLAETGPAVVVTINYRIHYLGWLSHSALTSENRRHTSGNYGSLDQIMALNWVRRNIRRFGGDPRRVLVFGQSAGGRNSCVLAASPLARGLISRAAMISSSCEDIPTLQRMEQSGNAYVAKLGCGNAPSVPACLRSKPLADVVLAAVREPLVPGGFQLGPNIDGVLLVEQPLETFRKPSYADFPLLISAAADEVANALLPGFWTTPVNTAADHETAVRALFADEVQKDVLRVYPVANYETPRNTLIQVLTDSFLVCPTRRIARAAAAGGTPVWRAFYTHAYSSGPLAPLGAAHITDMPFWFNNLALPGFIPRESEVNLGNTVSAYLLGFAANGDPNRPGTAMWPRFDPVTDVYLRLDDVQKPASGVRAALCDFWDSVRVAQVAQ